MLQINSSSEAGLRWSLHSRSSRIIVAALPPCFLTLIPQASHCPCLIKLLKAYNKWSEPQLQGETLWEQVNFLLALMGFQCDISSLKCLCWLSFLLSISARQCMYGILQAWSGLNSLIWVCLENCVRRVRDDCFRRTSQADGQILPYADSLSILKAAACAFAVCYQAGDWFLCPSCLPFPLCFKAQFREAYDVLTRAPWITLLKDASAQNILQKQIGSVLPFVTPGLLPFRARPQCVMSRKDEPNVWQPNVWLQKH